MQKELQARHEYARLRKHGSPGIAFLRCVGSVVLENSQIVCEDVQVRLVIQ